MNKTQEQGKKKYLSALEEYINKVYILVLILCRAPANVRVFFILFQDLSAGCRG